MCLVLLCPLASADSATSCPSKPSSQPGAYSLHTACPTLLATCLPACHFLALARELEIGASEELLLFWWWLGSALERCPRDPLGSTGGRRLTLWKSGTGWPGGSSRSSGQIFPLCLAGGPPPLPFAFQLF